MKVKGEEINKRTSISPLTQLSQHMHPSHMITVFKTFNYRQVRIAHPHPCFYSCALNRISISSPCFIPKLTTLSLLVPMKTLAYRRVRKKVHPWAMFFLFIPLRLSPRQGHTATPRSSLLRPRQKMINNQCYWEVLSSSSDTLR